MRRLMMAPLGILVRWRKHPVMSPKRMLPPAVFAPRNQLIEMQADELFLTQLNCRFSLRTPIDWQLKNQPHTHLQRLALHYHEFLEATPVKQGVAILLDWIAANPPYQRGYWLDSWNSYAVSIRGVCWMQWLTLHLVTISAEERTQILGSLVQQIQFLRRNLETDICGNHLIKNIRCLLWASAFFNGSEAEEWRQVGETLLRQQLEVQFLPDGMHFELSPAYHCQVFGDLVECLTVVSGQVRSELCLCLQKAAQVIADLTHPDGLISLMSDGGLHMVYSPAECLSAFVNVGGRMPELRGGFVNQESGYYGFRSENTCLIVDCGPICDDVLPAHGHADILSFEWDVQGQRFVVDAGVFEYEAGEQRRRNRSVISHNTVSVGGRDQCELIGSFRAGRRSYGKCDFVEVSTERFQLAGHHHGFATDSSNIVHRRAFDADSKSLRIRDTIEGSGGEMVTSRLLFHDECQVEQVDAFNLRIQRANVVVHLSSQSAVRICNGTWSPDFGVLKKTVCLELDYGTVPCQSEFEFIIESVENESGMKKGSGTNSAQHSLGHSAIGS
jgi:uncharacterized heparinase superfamily protein